MLIEVHMLKNYPASNLNRDETGAPKTCYFGGAQRGRISSQCLKRSWRTSPIFGALQSKCVRSRMLPDAVVKELSDLPEKERGYARKYIQDAVRGDDKKRGKQNDLFDEEEEGEGKTASSKEQGTGQVISYTQDDVRTFVQVLREMWNGNELVKPSQEQKKRFMERIRRSPERALTLDIALFGRMVTSEAFVNVEAAMQVAHAVSTHAVNLESDYFTAVDDLVTGGESAGAAMIGDIDFDSCCYYQYASLDTDKLRENLNNSPEVLAKADELIPALLRVMALSNPSGKQNTFAAHVPPEVMLVEFKPEKIPLSYANAFAAPVSRFSRQLVKESADRLAEEVDLMDRCYALPVDHRAWLSLRSERRPEKGERFERFGELTRACAEWAKGWAS